jgi:hypothetical protein
VLSTNLVLILLALPDVPSQARSAEVGLWVEPGLLVSDVRARLAQLQRRREPAPPAADPDSTAGRAGG